MSRRLSLFLAVSVLAGAELCTAEELPYERAEDHNDVTAPSAVGGSRAATEREPVVTKASGQKTGLVELEGAEIPLTRKEQEALELAKKWMAARDNPVLGANGQVRFLFGATLPVIVCAPLRGTDIALQPGEVVKPDGVHTGDSVRWQVMPSVSGPAGNETTHLIVKPTDVGLSTNMIVGTDRRTYHFELVSRREDWMPCVGFNYPEEIESEWQAYQRKAQVAKAANTLPETGESIQSLDFSYRIDGAAPWKPLRVYNNGVKTVVQLPRTVVAAEAPALLVLGDNDKEQIVNYRLLGDRYVVDLVFEKAVLVLGVGRKQTKVTIVRAH